MTGANEYNFLVSDATEGDLPQIEDKYCRASLLRDYFRLATTTQMMRCMVLRKQHEILGFSLLVFQRPEFWPGSSDFERLPEIVGLSIDQKHRDKGLGTLLIRAIEAEVARSGHERIFLTVAPVVNPKAYALFKRLGFQGIQSAPVEVEWAFEDTEGNVYSNKNLLLDMFKEI